MAAGSTLSSYVTMASNPGNLTRITLCELLEVGLVSGRILKRAERAPVVIVSNATQFASSKNVVQRQPHSSKTHHANRKCCVANQSQGVIARVVVARSFLVFRMQGGDISARVHRPSPVDHPRLFDAMIGIHSKEIWNRVAVIQDLVDPE